MSYKVFISHSSIDTWVAAQIEHHAKAVGAETFLDAYDIDVGDKFNEKIRDSIKAADEILILFTARALKSEYVTAEIAMAYSEGLRISPVLYDVDEKKVKSKPFVEERSFIHINDLDKYFSQLSNRTKK